MNTKREQARIKSRKDIATKIHAAADKFNLGISTVTGIWGATIDDIKWALREQAWEVEAEFRQFNLNNLRPDPRKFGEPPNDFQPEISREEVIEYLIQELKDMCLEEQGEV